MDNGRILIIEGFQEISGFLRIFFEEEGYAVSKAVSAEEGLKKALNEKPDVVFVDLNIQKMGGIDVLRRLKEIDNGLTVIVITGFGTMEEARSAMKLGAYDYITKPIDIDFIKEVVSRALGSARLKNSRRLAGAVGTVR